MATTIGTSYGGDLNRPGYTNEGGITGIREDLADIISDISPTETPFLTKCGKQSTSTHTLSGRPQSFALPRSRVRSKALTPAPASSLLSA